MRLWHYKLIPLLPKSQLLAQWRELNSIFRRQDRHILINYVYEYPKEQLLQYSILVQDEMFNRGYLVKSTSAFDSYFMGVYHDWFEPLAPFPDHHNLEYLEICCYNLYEKYLRGQKDFTEQNMCEIWNLLDEEKERSK